MGDEVCGVSMREVKAFVEKGSLQQQCCLLFLSTIFIDAGTILYLVSLKASAVGLVIGSIFLMLGLVYDVRIIAEQVAVAKNSPSPVIANILTKRLKWRWACLYMNAAGGLLSVVGSLLYWPGSTRPDVLWSANAIFAVGMLLFAFSFAVVVLDVRMTEVELAKAQQKPYPDWDLTMWVMVGYLLCLITFACGGLLFIAEDLWKQDLGTLMFAVGTVAFTGMCLLQLRFLWHEHLQSGPTAGGVGVLGGGAANGNGHAIGVGGAYGSMNGGPRHLSKAGSTITTPLL